MGHHAFRIHLPTLAILKQEDGQKIPITIPCNAIVTTPLGIIAEDRLVDVVWEGQTVMMFTQDLRVRGTRVTGASRAGA